MYRAQILLERWQYDSLKARSERDRRSISDVVREAVSTYLGRSTPAARNALEGIEGVGADRLARGRQHDRLLYPPRSRKRGRR
jgi:hypothetical protein